MLVIHASSSFSLRRRGSTLRRLQHRSGSRLQSAPPCVRSCSSGERIEYTFSTAIPYRCSILSIRAYVSGNRNSVSIVKRRKSFCTRDARSINTMPSAPNADEIATRLPKVSNAHARVWSGPQGVALDCNSAICSFTKWTPHRRSDFWLEKKHVLRRTPCSMPGPRSRRSPTTRPDRQDARPHPQEATSVQPTEERAADPLWLCDELADTWS